jgi:hypothetical protein
MFDISVTGKAKPTRPEVSNDDIATPERLAKSASALAPNGARVFKDELLDRLAVKGQLYPDPTINEACRLAGERYYADWYGSNMSALKAIDYGKVSGGKGASGSQIAPGGIALHCRKNYRAARAVLGDKYRKPVEAILLEGQSDLVTVGKSITGAANPRTCRAVAIERFTAGLYLLAKHYRLAQ